MMCKYLPQIEGKSVVTCFLVVCQLCVCSTPFQAHGCARLAIAALLCHITEYESETVLVASICVRFVFVYKKLLTQSALQLRRSCRQRAFQCLVRLVKGEVQRKTEAKEKALLAQLGGGNVLDKADTITVLKTTLGHILMRFDIYLRCPVLLWVLSKTFSPTSHGICLEEFSKEPEDSLEPVYSSKLQQEAHALGRCAQGS